MWVGLRDSGSLPFGKLRVRMTGGLGGVEMGGVVALAARYPFIAKGAMNGAPGYFSNSKLEASAEVSCSCWDSAARCGVWSRPDQRR